MLRFLPLFVLALPALGAELTCTTPGYNAYPRDTVYTGSRHVSSRWSGALNPAVVLYTTAPTTYCTPADCTVVEIKFTDDVGTLYAAPTYNAAIGRGTWSSPTVIPASTTQSNVYVTVRYRHTPADGSTLIGTGSTNADQAFTLSNDTILSGSTYNIVKTNATAVAGITTSYQPPNQHDFGDIPPSGAGIPLVLPAPSSGSLAAKILWNGPAGISMTRKIGSGSATDVKKGTTYQLDTDGKGLQLDLNASNTASPGAITGNLTLTLTCP